MSKPSILVIFGITGDLSQRYLMTALYNLFKNNELDTTTEVLGITRRDVSNEQLFDQIKSNMDELGFEYSQPALQQMFSKINMFKMDLDDSNEYNRLKEHLAAIEDHHGVCMDRSYYLSIPPQIYGGIIELMGKAELNNSCSHGNAKTKILVEKPFGYDLPSAQKLLASTQNVFEENQTFRIDHFLTKSSVRDFVEFRNSNPDFDAIWNAEHINSIEILASEDIDIEGRVKFYEPLGALRDFIQNHLVQLLAITTMDLPSDLSSDLLHAHKEKALSKVLEVNLEEDDKNAVRGQYEGYLEAVGNQESITETYASITVYSEEPRWQKVPITLWTGKALANKKYEIVIHFEDKSTGQKAKLIYRIQPDPSVTLESSNPESTSFKTIGEAASAFSAILRNYGKTTPNAYEAVILNALAGNHAVFASKAEILNSWRIIQPVINKWTESGDGLIIYKVGQVGPLAH